MKFLVFISIAVLVCQANAFVLGNEVKESLKEDVCQDCKDLLTKMKAYLLSPKDENATASQGDSLLCSFFNSTMLHEGCKYIVDQAVTGLMQALGSSIVPDEMCVQFELCTKKRIENTPLHYKSTHASDVKQEKATCNEMNSD